MLPLAPTNHRSGAAASPIRLACWVALVAAIAAVNYAARFDGGGGTGKGRDAVYNYSTFANGMIVYAFCLVLVIAMAVDRWDLLALRKPRSWARAVALATGVVAVAYASEAIVAAIPLPQSPGHEQGLTPTHWVPGHAGAFAANVFLIALVAPIVEELIFRGVGQSLLAFVGRWPSMILVGLAFGAWHGLLEALLVLVPFGIALAWLRDRTKSVVPGMIAHAVLNGSALALAVLG